MKLRLETMLVLFGFVLTILILGLLWEVIKIRKDAAAVIDRPRPTAERTTNGFQVPPPPW